MSVQLHLVGDIRCITSLMASTHSPLSGLWFVFVLFVSPAVNPYGSRVCLSVCVHVPVCLCVCMCVQTSFRNLQGGEEGQKRL